jgi:hypothetical protein
MGSPVLGATMIADVLSILAGFPEVVIVTLGLSSVLLMADAIVGWTKEGE